MATRHGFQPIVNQANFEQALNYITKNVLKLGKTILGEDLPIDTLAIFSQSNKEGVYLESHIRSLGPVSRFTHGKTLYVEPSNLVIESQKITYLGVRSLDPTRPEVGYGDFTVNKLEKYLNNEFVSQIKSSAGQTMLEIHHPDFDVRGYIVER